MDIASSSAGATGDVMSLTGNNANSNPIFTLAGSPSGKTLTLDFGTAYANAKIKIQLYKFQHKQSHKHPL